MNDIILFCTSAGLSSIATLPPKPDLTSSLSYLPKILELNQFLRILNPQMLVYDVAMWQKSMAVPWEIQYLFNVNSCKVWTVIFWKRLGTVSQDYCWRNVWTLLWSVNHLNKRCVWLAIFNWSEILLVSVLNLNRVLLYRWEEIWRWNFKSAFVLLPCLKKKTKKKTPLPSMVRNILDIWLPWISKEFPMTAW